MTIYMKQHITKYSPTQLTRTRLTQIHGLHEHLCWSRQMPSLFLLTKTRITRTGAENHVTNLLITRTTFSEFGIKIASNWYQNQSSKSKCNFNNRNQTPVDIIMNTLAKLQRDAMFSWIPECVLSGSTWLAEDETLNQWKWVFYSPAGNVHAVMRLVRLRFQNYSNVT